MQKSEVDVMYVMGVESSCDETSVAIVKDGKTVLSNVVLSQIDIHKEYGGVVPEIASREHVKGISLVFDQAIKKAGIRYDEIDLVAVTEGPGLIGSLLIGVAAAKVIAMNYDIPIIGIHHIAGHIYANNIEHDIEFPCLALVVSGGHTQLVLMNQHYSFHVIGETLDDAVGEAYDKVARVLSLPYPGGPLVDKLAQTGKDIYHLPRPMIDSKDYTFSFSGLKSHIINLHHNMIQRNEHYEVADICASFQAAVTDILVKKTHDALRQYQVKQVIVAGGVAANKGLRAKIAKEITEVPVFFPSMAYCTDNAAMIGVAGYFKYQKTHQADDYSINGASRLELK
jgi:N6-L-threonylcarbamoyladenine synthase